MRISTAAVALFLASASASAEESQPAPPASAGSPAQAVAPVPSAPPAPATERAPARTSEASRFGLLLDLGLPEGAALSATFRPVPSVRFFAGPAWNYVGWGIQGGVSLVPWHWAVTPVLTAEAGRYFGADLSFITKGGQGIPTELRPLLRSMTYTYGAILAGLEFGSQSGFTYSLALGLSYIALDAKGTVTKTDGSGNVVTFRDPHVTATLPSVKLGFHYWF
jgi:hypothetical protein